MASEATTLEVPGPNGVREMRVSSPSRVLWPDLGITKLDYAKYLVAVGEAFVAANGDRPVALQRYPDGVGGEQYFSKNPPKGAPEWIRTTDGDLPERSAASDARHRRARGRRLDGADEHDRVPPVAVPRRRQRSSRSAATRSGPAARQGLPGCRARRARAAHGARGGRPHRVREDFRQPRHSRLRPDRAAARFHRRAARGDLGRARARTSHARRRHDRLVEGGARRPRLRRLQPGGT